jgi:hypothetical protein
MLGFHTCQSWHQLAYFIVETTHQGMLVLAVRVQFAVVEDLGMEDSSNLDPLVIMYQTDTLLAPYSEDRKGLKVRERQIAQVPDRSQRISSLVVAASLSDQIIERELGARAIVVLAATVDFCSIYTLCILALPVIVYSQ